ncbi:MAG: hypothetical protein UR26_C0002G0036 [candidate division TM6 bacterium GW2011_GWF2_32_72]|nr:MAG: hypothetical protein UR26_C0002G0036 [candidate division TM6 bacterium GW2011_GWF2_32_72]
MKAKIIFYCYLFLNLNILAEKGLDFFDYQKIKCGWMDLDNLDGVEEAAAELIFKANLNLLWIRFNPELYFSKISERQNQTEKIFEIAKKIFDKLYMLCAKSKKEMPKIFLGTELTSNFGRIKPVTCVVDIFGRRFDKIPNPLDFDNYWKQEFLDPFDKFMDMWNKVFDEKVQISGVFFDLEMYHAQNQASMYSDKMDFSDFSWNLFWGQNLKIFVGRNLKTVAQRVNFLRKYKMFNSYYNFLQTQSKNIAEKIKKHVRKKLPKAKFAVYMVLINNNWFYKGFLQGLSEKNDPIILATFRNDYKSNTQFLAENNIYVNYIGLILLGQLQKDRDFGLIAQTLRHYDGVWYNRFSWLPYLTKHKMPKDVWWKVESSPLDPWVVAEKIGDA